MTLVISIPLVAHPLFRSSPLTESLEQTSEKLNIKAQNFIFQSIQHETPYLSNPE